MKKFFIIFISAIVLLLSGCSHTNNKYHIVKKGDTLYSIAKKHKLKLDHVAKMNSIKFPYSINKGQKLFLANNLSNNNNSKLSNLKTKNTTKNTTKLTTTTKNIAISHKDWAWPARGQIVQQFIASGPNKVQGINIAGKKGDPILSAANGRVVYSGNNLRGYGNLVIIKHNQDFLSAYAHNEKILVKEQQEVKKGQQIATMGNSEAKSVVLHFEVRYKGKPIDPLKVLANL